MVRAKMGKLLLDAGHISPDQLQSALDRQAQTKLPLGKILIEQGAISEQILLKFLGQQYGLSVVLSLPASVDRHLTQLVSQEWAQQHVAVPVRQVGKRLTVAMVDPANVSLLDELKFRTGCRVLPVLALESHIRERIQALYGSAQSEGRSSPLDTRGSGNEGSKEDPPGTGSFAGQGGIRSRPAGNSEDMAVLLERAASSLNYTQATSGVEPVADNAAPLVALVNRMMSDAAEMGASDIHLEPEEGSVRVRFRLDGVLLPFMTYPLSLRNAVVSRLKILAHLDIAERRLPQDGRMTFSNGPHGKLDVRVSVLPSHHGEKVVLRLLNRSGLALDLPSLGLEDKGLDTFLAALEKPHGMILVTGPTGSGKTTTLYSALQVLNTPDVNIVTAEDPVEYHFSGITQVQIKEDIGLNFAAVLRAFLRQDPDIMMVGEIRDRETAQIAVKAALTGHRVLSTLHTADAVRTVTRLLDMGVEPFLVASSIRLILAQRLVRRVCSECQRPDPLPVEELVKIGFTQQEADQATPMRGSGCDSCHGTGYKGRVGLFQVLPISETFQSLILRQPSPDLLQRQALQDGLITLRQSGLEKIKAGLTTIDEVVSVSAID